MAGLYVHVPFCRKKCSYCGFVSGPAPAEVIKRYFDALEQEILLRAREPSIKEMYFDSLFIGGGTPSFVHHEYLCSIIERLYSNFHIANGPALEGTVECNPDSLTLEWLEALKPYGINRISIGVQAMDDRMLHVLGRVHDSRQVLDAVNSVRAVGIENISIDLMYSIPGQDMGALEQSLERALALMPVHVSCYELTLEDGTVMSEAVRNGRAVYPDQETRLAFTRLAESILESRGLRQYEISNFAVPGYECRHNIGYWQGREYLGIGCSACSFIKGRRIRNDIRLDSWIAALENGKPPIQEVEELDFEAAFREAFVMAMRMNRGVAIQDFRESYNMDPVEYYGDLIPDMEARGLMEFRRNGTCLALTERGRYISNYVLSNFV